MDFSCEVLTGVVEATRKCFDCEEERGEEAEIVTYSDCGTEHEDVVVTELQTRPWWHVCCRGDAAEVREKANVRTNVKVSERYFAPEGGRCRGVVGSENEIWIARSMSKSARYCEKHAYCFMLARATLWWGSRRETYRLGWPVDRVVAAGALRRGGVRDKDLV